MAKAAKKKAAPAKARKARLDPKGIVKPKRAKAAKPKQKLVVRAAPPREPGAGPSAAVLDRLWHVVTERRDADPELSHSARLLSRGTGKIAQKFGEEAVECLIEAVAGNRPALIGESADVLYHLLVVWVDAGIAPEDVWAELERREGVSGIAEKASRTLPLALGLNTRKIP